MPEVYPRGQILTCDENMNFVGCEPGLQLSCTTIAEMLEQVGVAPIQRTV